MAANRKKSCLDEGTGYRVFSVFNTCLLVLILFLTAYPVYFVLIASISDPTKMVANYGLMWLPHFPLSLTSYRMVFRHSLLLSGFGNTLFIVIVGLAFNMVLTVLGAYLLSLKNSLLKKPIAYLILFTMYFSGGIVPGYLNIKSLHLMNTLWALILPGAISTYNMLIMRSAIGALPDALMEAAKLDGASHFQRILNVVVPLTGATSAVLMLYYAVGHWNAWFNASIYLQDNEKLPIQNVLRAVLIANSNILNAAAAENDQVNEFAESIKYAAIVLTTVPVLCVYPFLQKYFVKGVMIGAVKG